jgi:hypothetical protein
VTDWAGTTIAFALNVVSVALLAVFVLPTWGGTTNAARSFFLVQLNSPNEIAGIPSASSSESRQFSASSFF